MLDKVRSTEAKGCPSRAREYLRAHVMQLQVRASSRSQMPESHLNVCVCLGWCVVFMDADQKQYLLDRAGILFFVRKMQMARHCGSQW